MSGVKDLIAQLDAAKLKAEADERERQQQEYAAYQQALAIAEEEARLAAVAEAKRREAEAKAERERWKVDEEACAEEVAQLKAKFLEKNKTPKTINNVQIKDIPTLVVDIGSNTIKAGYAGRDAPEHVISAVVGTISSDYVMDLKKHANVKDMHFGDDVWGYKDVLRIHRVVQRGKVVNWKYFQALLEYLFFDEMKIPKEQIKDMPIIVTEPPLNPKANRSELAIILFEHFKFPAIYVGNTSSFALFATGRITGVVVDIGYGVSTSVAVYEGTVIPESLKRLDIGGMDLDSYFTRLLNDAGHPFNESSVFDQFVVRDMKERLAYVARDYEAEVKRLGGSAVKSRWAKGGNDIEKIYDVTAYGNNYLPGFDKRRVKDQITLGWERFKCSEALFRPGELIGRDHILRGVHGMVMETIKNVPIDLRKEMFASIILSGGTTLLPGFAERVRSELRTIAPDSVLVEVHEPHNRHLAVWTGASILGSAHHFNPHWVSRDEYLQFGSDIVFTPQ